MKKTSKKNLLKQQSQQEPLQPQQPDHHNLLQYYKNKIDSLCQERMQWLAKFDQCKSKLKQKHSLKQSVLKNKNQQRELNRNIVHHQIALIDQRLNVIRMERENLLNDYRDAEEIIKIEQLLEQYPKQIEKMLPCNTVSGQLIKNDLNIHNSRQKKPALRTIKNQQPTNFNIKNSLHRKSQKSNIIAQSNIHPLKKSYLLHESGKITKEQLFERQIIEIQQNQQSEIQCMRQLKYKLEELIKKTKEQQKQKLFKERDVVNHLNQQYKQLQKKHKSLAEEYFAGRRQQKQSQEDLNKQTQDLICKNKTLEEKVNKEIKTYEKENKAKQTLILKKSQDFQQNYKAKMRAKERNLQALKQNYQKMQNICIQKVSKLENALNKAKHKLDQAEERRIFLVDQLREQLHGLQKKVQEQKLQRQQRQLKIRLKVEKQKLRNQQQKQKKQREEAKAERNRLIEESYKRTVKIKRQKSGSKERSKSKKKLIPKTSIGKSRKDIYGKQGQESQQDNSLQMDDLQNIRKQIGQLQTKIAADTR